jgi:predicted CxxxxCH...CXXCH cytochrome family protein
VQLHATGVEDLAFGTLANNRPDPWQASTYFTGTATSATTTSMTDSTKTFGSRNAVRNQTIKFLSGTANGQSRTITNSSSTVVYWNTTQGVTGLTAGTQYQIGNPMTPIPLPALASFNRTTGTCSNTWCHGFTATNTTARANLRGCPTHGGTTNNFTIPLWTKVDGTQDSCSGCHGNSNTSYPAYPATGRHTSESNHRVSCGRCHGGTYTTTVADKSVHVNGVVETPSIGWNKATNSCNATGSGCHSGTMTGWY